MVANTTPVMPTALLAALLTALLAVRTGAAGWRTAMTIPVSVNATPSNASTKAKKLLKQLGP
jgi:hypothetical protein